MVIKEDGFKKRLSLAEIQHLAAALIQQPQRQPQS